MDVNVIMIMMMLMMTMMMILSWGAGVMDDGRYLLNMITCFV